MSAGNAVRQRGVGAAPIPPSGASGRIPQLDGVRATAILAVIAFHLTGAVGARNVTQGQAGVDALLLLSGFLLALNLRDETPAAFLLRRLETLAPKYWLLLTIFVVVCSVTAVPLEPVAGPEHPVASVGLHLLFLNALSGPHFFSLTDAWWFMSAIVLLYLTFVCVRGLVRRGWWGAVLLYGVALQAIGVWLFDALATPEYSGIDSHFIVRIGAFWIGATVGTAARALRTGRPRTDEPRVLQAVAVAAAAYEGASLSGRYEGLAPIYPTVAGLVVVAIGLAVGFAVQRPGSPPAIRAGVAWLAATSFEIYLVHQPFIATFNEHGFSRLGLGSTPRDRLTIGAGIGLLLAGPAAYGLSQVPFRRIVHGSERRRFAVLGAIAASAAAVSLGATAVRPLRAEPVEPLPPAPGKGPAGVSPLPAVVSHITPTSGAAGTSVVIAGDHFESAVKVRFGDTDARFVVDGYLQITATAPRHANGPVTVTVVNRNGPSVASDQARFVYTRGR